jgi:AmmeMemoRadiSam system protein B
MSQLLPRLRGDLDLLASPIPEQPGILMRDPFRYSRSALVVPPLLGRCLMYFDGAHTYQDLHQNLTRLTGNTEPREIADRLIDGLSQAGFLDDDVFAALRTQTHERFQRADVRPAAFAGDGYPGDKAVLDETLSTWLDTETPPRIDAAARTISDVGAIAAPHVSPSGGLPTYAAAYRALAPNADNNTFVILGTSHYGRPNRFGVTRKSFRTPLGTSGTNTALVDQIIRAAPDAVDVEDYCHAIEHSIEFQVLFLQKLYGPAVRILPILCGPFTDEQRPENDRGVATMLDAVRAMQDHGAGHQNTAERDRLTWVLGVDMAHVGRRYGDRCDARAFTGPTNEVAERDQARLDRIVNGDPDGFWRLVNEHGADDLKWCGASPLYTFARACPNARGRVLHYDQWNIDDASVVSFAALAFDLDAR